MGNFSVGCPASQGIWRTWSTGVKLTISQFSSVAQSCPTLCDPMSCSTPGLPVHHQLPEFTQTHVHRVGDAIQPSHLLSSPSPALNLSQHQGIFKCMLIVQLPSPVHLFATPWTAAHQASLSFPEFVQTHVHRIDDAIQPSHLLSSPSPALNLSQPQGLFQ